MAKIGLNNFRFAVASIANNGTITYGGAQKPAKAISFTFEPTVSDAKLYADDSLAEVDSRVTGGEVTMGIDREDDATMCTLLGHSKDSETNVITDNVNDSAPYVGVGRITKLMEDGVIKYRATILALVKFKEPSDEDNTQGESIEFSTTSLSGTMKIPENGNWRVRKVFTTQADALSFIEEYLGGTPTSQTSNETPASNETPSNP